MTDPLTTRLPPHDRDAERGVLGGILRDPETLAEAQQLLTVESFYFDCHRKIYAAVCDLADASQPIDLVLLYDRLRKTKHLDDAGGREYLVETWEAVPTGANVAYHAKLVRDAAMLRGLIHASNEIARDSYDRAQSADELVGQAERKILDVAKHSLVGETHQFSGLLSGAFTRIDTRCGKDGLNISGLSTGWIDLDNITAGLQNSELVVVGARPSVGKTALGLGLVRNIVTADPNTSVLFVSLEMSRQELAERLLCCEAKVDNHKVRKGQLNSDEIQKLMDAGDRLRPCRLHLDDTPSRSMTQIAATCRRLARKEERYGGLKLVVVDYLQMVEPEDRRAPRQEQVAQVSRRLKHLARELEIPVVALCQVNRASEDRQDHRPRLSDLRESGGIEADADVVMLLHRPGKYGTEEDNVLEVDIAKQRNGPTDTITLSFDKRYTRFNNYSPALGAY